MLVTANELFSALETFGPKSDFISPRQFVRIKIIDVDTTTARTDTRPRGDGGMISFHYNDKAELTSVDLISSDWVAQP